MATKETDESYETCLVADPHLLGELPKDFADQMLQSTSCSTKANCFEEACWETHKKNLTTAQLMAGISTVKIALFIRVPKQSECFFLSAVGQYMAAEEESFKRPGTLCFSYKKESMGTSKDTQYLASLEHPHIKMLRERGEKTAVKELAQKFILHTSEYDLVLKVENR